MEYTKYLTGTAEVCLLDICDEYHEKGISCSKFIEQLRQDDLYLLHFSKIIGEDEHGNKERVVWVNDTCVDYIIDSFKKTICILEIF